MRKFTPREMSEMRASNPEQGLDSDFLDVLSMLNVIGNDQCREAVQYKALSIALRLMHWPDGRAGFRSDDIAVGVSLPEEISALELLLLGLRRCPGLNDVMVEALPSDETVYATADVDDSSILDCLTRTERNILSLAEQQATVGDIRTMGALAQMDVAPSLATLFGAGLLQPTDQTRAGGTGTGWPKMDGTGIPMAGHTGDGPIAEVLGGIIRGHMTGALHVDSTDKRSLYFQDGELVFARSMHPQEWLGYLAQEVGIERATLARARAIQLHRKHDLRLGAILLRMRALSLDGLTAMLRKLMATVWAGVFRCEPCGYRFEEGELTNISQIEMDRPTVALLMDGIELLSLPEIVRWLRARGNALVRIPATSGPLDLDSLGPHFEQLLERTDVEDGLSLNQIARDDRELRAGLLLVVMGAARMVRRSQEEAVDVELTPVDEQQEEPEEVAELELDWAETADYPAAQATDSAPSTDAPAADNTLVAHLKQELADERQRSESAIARAYQELGAIKERLRRLHEENRQLREDNSRLVEQNRRLADKAAEALAAAEAASQPAAGSRKTRKTAKKKTAKKTSKKTAKKKTSNKAPAAEIQVEAEAVASAAPES
jgi:regulator of replication initiation timing